MYDAKTARKESKAARDRVEEIFIQEDLKPLYNKIKFDANRGKMSSSFNISKLNNTKVISIFRARNVPDIHFRLEDVNKSFSDNGFDLVEKDNCLVVGWNE